VADVGFIGLGNMGSALAANLVASGFDVLSHDIAGPAGNPDGAAFIDDLESLATAATTVVLSLPDGAASERVCRSLISHPGSTVRHVVDTSTVGISAARTIDALLDEGGVDYIDAPVSGGAAGAKARTLTVMYAGRVSALETAAPILAGLSDRRIHVGDEPGMAQALKLANNFLSATALAATSEAVAFGTAVGLDMATMLDVLNASSGQSAATSDKFVNHVLNGRYASGFANTLMAKDVALYLSETATHRTPAAIGRVTSDIWRRFAAAEPGGDFTRIYPFTLGDAGRDQEAGGS
jgi:3-hydroxyisobutyrate dehydrogenase